MLLGGSYPNFFHAILLSPSGGSILSSPAKKEYGKKDAAQGGVFPALRTHPLGWGSVVRVVMFRLPDKLASASVPCLPVSKPLAASLALTDCCGNAGPPWSAAYSINQSYAARSHSQRCKSQRLP